MRKHLTGGNKGWVSMTGCKLYLVIEWMRSRDTSPLREVNSRMWSQRTKNRKRIKNPKCFPFPTEFSHLFPMKLPLHCSISFETSAKIYPQRSLCRVTISTTVTVGPKWKAKVLLNSSCWEYKCSPCTPTEHIDWTGSQIWQGAFALFHVAPSLINKDINNE